MHGGSRRSGAVEADKATADAKQKKDDKWKTKKKQKLDALRQLTHIESAATIPASITNATCDLQLDWYCVFVDSVTGPEVPKVPRKNEVKVKAKKIGALKEAINHYDALSEEVKAVERQLTMLNVR